MNYDDEYFRRLLREQDEFRKIIDMATGRSALERAIEATDPFRQLREQARMALYFRSPALDATESSLQSAKSIASHFEDTWASDLVAHKKHVDELVRSVQSPFQQELQRLEAEYHLLHEAGRPSTAIYEAIQKPIEDALRFSNLLGNDKLLGLSYEELIKRINPLFEHLREFENFFEQVQDEEEAEPDALEPPRPERVANNLLILKRLLECVQISVGIWATAMAPDLAETALDRVEEVMIYLTERQDAVGNSIDHLMPAESLSPSVTTTTVRLRSGPSTETDELEMLAPGTSFLVTGHSDRWASGIASLADGTTRVGWVNADYLVRTPSGTDATE